MERYRIAFFTADWNYELVEQVMQGLKRFVDEHPEVSLCVFDSFGKEGETRKDRSEFEIYELPDLSLFDGALIHGSQIVNRRVREMIGAKVKKSGIPALTLDCPVEDFPLLSIDNRKAEREITNHFIREHGARKLVYLTGLLDNGSPEGRQRMDGFLDACRENGIAEEDREIVRCTWRTEDGVREAERFFQDNLPLPDAFLCANDEMALGVLSVLLKYGKRVPQDVLLGGFDCVSSAELSDPSLSTIRRDCGEICYQGMQLLLNIVCRREIRSPKLTDIPYEFIRSESCGCRAHKQSAYIRKIYYRQIRFLKNFHERQDQLTEELLNAEGLNDLLSTVEKHSGIFGCEQIWLCVNDYYYDNYERKRWDQDSRKYGRQMILAAGEGGDSDSLKGQRFDTKELLPADIMEKNRFLIFYPLYYNTYSIGYLVMNSISTAAKLNLHKSILSFLEIAIENIRKKCLLRELNTTLDQLYVHDSLTGVYNRHAYSRFGKQAFRSFQESKEGSLIVFCDIDGMKEINDGLGHDFGDIAITAAANILKSACGPADFIMRYGGDEFLVIASGRCRTLPEKVECLNKQYNDTSGMPFHLSLSIGSIFVKEPDGLPLDEYVKQADEAMYRAKKSGNHIYRGRAE